MKRWIPMMAAVTLGLSTAARADEPEKLNDAKIATIGLTAHQIDVDRGTMAAKKTKTVEVKQLAEQMVSDHKAGKQEILNLAKKLKVTPEESSVTKSLKAGAAETAAKLKKLKGADFDKAYVDAEVGYHEAVIGAVEKVLLPNVQNAEVKDALVNLLPTLKGHLVHARQVQGFLASAK